MKLITRNTDYAIRALNYIAYRKDEIVSASEIAKKLGIRRPFLRRVLQILQKKGLLKSYEGKSGGFSLAVSPDEILLVDLIRIFQGPVELTSCLFKKKICPDIRVCSLKKRIENIEDIVIKELKSVNIASLAGHY